MASARNAGHANGDVYFCPQGKILETTGRLHNGGTTFLYRGQQIRLHALPAEAEMQPNTPRRQIPRDWIG